jgi:Tfp pilus assembly protein PilN
VRPVNLIPAEERRGDRGPLRAGPVSYVVVGVLAVIFIGMVASAWTGKSISNKESDKVKLEAELAEATAKSAALSEFQQFREIHDTRTATVSSLAQSRFDWERVMKELSLVIPSNVWLVNLTGSVSNEVQLNDGAEIAIRDSIAGPALELIGCATGQEGVAGFIAALEDIDGVTRVGVESSMNRGDDSGSDESAAGTEQSDSDDCRTETFIYQFKIVVAFDAVPAPPTATAAPGVPAAPAPGTDTQLADTSVSGG